MTFIHACTSDTKQNRGTEGCSKLKSRETRQVQERLVSTLEHMRVPKCDRTSIHWCTIYIWSNFENDDLERILSFKCTVLCNMLEYINIEQIAKRRTSSVLAQHANTAKYLLDLVFLNIYYPCNFQDYTITIYLNQYWKDERLAYHVHDNVTSMTLTGDFAEKIWVPDTFFANDKNSFLHDVTEKNKMIRLFGNGSVIYGMR